MLAKITSKNQVTIPKKIIEKIPDVEHFEVEFKDGVIILKPVRIVGLNLEQIRSKMEELGLKEDSVSEAVKWARARK